MNKASRLQYPDLLLVFMGTILLLFFLSLSASAQSLTLLNSELQNATSLSVTQNFVYIVEQGQNRVLKFNQQGVQVESIGGKGSGDYQFSGPVDIDATNGLKVFITDYKNRRVQVFDRRGQFLSSIYRGETFGNSRRYNPTQISVNSLGEVFFVDETADQVYRFDLDSNLMDEFRISSEIASVDEMQATSEEIFILDKENEAIHRLALNGSYRGFLPAKGLNAFCVTEAGFWKVFKDRLVLELGSGGVVEKKFDKVISPVAVDVVNNTAFILTNTRLFKVTLES